MSKTNLQVNLISFEDIQVSNNPQIRNFDLSYRLLGMEGKDPVSATRMIAAGETKTLFNGTRSTLIDGTTGFSISRPNATLNTYRFTAAAGTPPEFRTARSTSIDTTTQFALSVNGPIATLTNASGTPMVTTNIQIGDILNVFPGSGASVANLGRFIVLSKTTNSISFQNLSATAQAFVVLNTSLFLVYSNGGSNNQAQIGDKIIISDGFSSSIFGTYDLAEVTPNWFEIQVAAPNGIPLELGVIPGIAGMVVYSSAKQLLFIAALDRCAIYINGMVTDSIQIQPVDPQNIEKPGLYIQQGTVYQLAIKNLSLSNLQVLVASVE